MTGILCSLPIIGAPTASPPVDPLTVSLNRTTVSGSATTSTITTNSATATASGGTSPYTYAWSRLSGDSSITATAASSATSAFTRTGCIAGTSYSGTWRCTATDHDGNVAFSSDVSVTINRTDSGGSGGGGTFQGLTNQTVTQQGIAASETATFSINSNGTYTGGTWNTSSSAGSGYQVKATVTSGSLDTGTTGTWLTLSSNRSWSVTDSSQNNVATTCVFTLQIRASGTTTVLDSATITVKANALSSG